MGEVVFLSHQGLVCAVPSIQVLAADPGTAGAHAPIALWPSSSSEQPADDRVLDVLTQDGPARLPCCRVRIGRLSRSQVWGLPTLLRSVMAMPYIVGVGARDGDLVWLVNLRRFRPTDLNDPRP